MRSALALDDPELAALGGGDLDRGDRHPGPLADVLGQHLARVHPVEMVRSEDQDVVGLLIAQEVEVLVDRVADPENQRGPRRIWAGTGVT